MRSGADHSLCQQMWEMGNLIFLGHVLHAEPFFAQIPFFDPGELKHSGVRFFPVGVLSFLREEVAEELCEHLKCLLSSPVDRSILVPFHLETSTPGKSAQCRGFLCFSCRTGRAGQKGRAGNAGAGMRRWPASSAPACPARRAAGLWRPRETAVLAASQVQSQGCPCCLLESPQPPLPQHQSDPLVESYLVSSFQLLINSFPYNLVPR